jgi:hypothetical protein
MKRSRFTDSQILAVLKQADAGKAVPIYAESKGSVRRNFTNGVASTAAWTYR